VKQLEERKGMADLVFLEVPDEMPAQARRQQRDFDSRFLDPALAKSSWPASTAVCTFSAACVFETATNTMSSVERPLFFAPSAIPLLDSRQPVCDLVHGRSFH